MPAGPRGFAPPPAGRPGGDGAYGVGLLKSTVGAARAAASVTSK
jgi:hypothetical protein